MPVRYDPHPVSWRHDAVVYQDEANLCDVVGAYLAEGLEAGDTLLVLSSRDHRDGLIERLARRGHRWERAIGSQRIWWLDAREALEVFMMGREVDPERFERYIGGLLASCRRVAPLAGLRAYGEMVDRLWTEGHGQQALLLERLWNELAEKHDFALLCSHARNNLGPTDGQGEPGYLEVLETHRRVEHV